MSSSQESGKGKYGLGSIRETKSGTYEYRFSYFDEYGKSRRKSITCKTVDECVDKAEEFKKQIAMIVGPVTVRSTISDILRVKADSDFKKNFCGEQGYRRSLHTIDIIDRRGIGHMKIVDVKPGHIDAFLSSITDYSNNTVRKIYSMLASAFKMACDADVITHNYFLRADVRCPKSNKMDKEVRGLTESEQTKFVKTLMEHKVPFGKNTYKLQLLIELYSGMRMGEINALKPEDISFEEGVVKVRATVTKGIENRTFIKDSPKTKAGRRNVPISAALERVLRKALEEYKDNPEGLLFYDFKKGGIIETSQVNSFYRRICAKAEIPFYGQHALRHTFATRCIEAGVQAVVLKKWLGHTNIHITLDTYADVFERMNTDSIEKLDRLIDEMSVKMI